MPVSREQQLKNLQRRMADCDLPLKNVSQCLVFGNGNPKARIFFIGQAPGQKEDACGEPFVGRAGQILDELLSCAGLQRDEIYISSILKYFPPRNRAPRPEEIKAHAPYLVEQIRIIKPGLLVPMGNFAARFVLSGFHIEEMGKVPPITSLHGRPRTITVNDRACQAFPLFHPAAALYFPPLKKKMRCDMRRLRKLIS